MKATDTVADLVSNCLDGEFHDGEGIFFDAMSSRNTVRLTLTDAETDERTEYLVTIELGEVDTDKLLSDVQKQFGVEWDAIKAARNGAHLTEAEKAMGLDGK